MDRFFLTKPNTSGHNRVASVATLRWAFGIIPECRSDFLRNTRSASPESPTMMLKSTKTDELLRESMEGGGPGARASGGGTCPFVPSLLHE